MPSYTFRDKKTEETWTDLMSISEMEEYLEKNKNVGLVPAAPMIVGSVGQIDRHPESPLGSRYRRAGVKESKTKAVLQKHRKRAKSK